ncbi:MAG: PDZ domain-containing protein [Candidatus Sulfotelmatobacter sp.]
MRLKVGTLTPGTTVHLKVERSGQMRDISLALGEAPATKGVGNAAGGSAENSPMRGVQVDELTSDIRQQLGLKPDVKGVVVTNVAGDSPAADAGLQQGDVIEQINRQPVNSVADYQRLIEQSGKQSLVLLINRGGNTNFMVVQPE